MKESKARVTKLLIEKEQAVRDIAINLYKYDYINGEEIKCIMTGKKFDKPHVREFDSTIDGFIVRDPQEPKSKV